MSQPLGFTAHRLTISTLSVPLPHCRVSLSKSLPIWFLPLSCSGSPQISGLRGPQSQPGGKRALPAFPAETRGVQCWRNLERVCPGAKCSCVGLPASAVLPAWGGARALWRVSRGRGLASLGPRLPPWGSQAPPRSVPIGLGRPRP